MRPGVALALVLALPTAARGQARWSVRGEAGGEYDSNPGRVESVRDGISPLATPSSLARFVATGEVAAAPAAGQTLSLSGSLGGKLFTDAAAQPENVLVAQASAAWSVPVAERTAVALAAAYYDVWQKQDPNARDFRSTTPMLRLDQRLGVTGVLSVGAGYRWFAYKPDPDYDFQAPTAFATYHHLWPGGAAEGGADWEMTTGASAELRAFSGRACTADECPGPQDQPARRDQFWILHLEVTRTGAFLAGAGAALHGNASNSYGEPLLRALAHVRAVFLLPWELSLSGRAEIIATRYEDAVPLARNVMGTPLVSIEDESRSTVRLELVRPIGGGVEAGFRYTFYTNELAAGPVRYRRQTALVFLAWGAEN